MLFTSSIFLFFFLPLSLAAFSLCHLAENRWQAAKKHRVKDVVLLILSLLFYAFAGLEGLMWICAFIAVTYFFMALLKGGRLKKKGFIFSVGLIVSLSSLFIFKYVGYLSELAGVKGIAVSLAAPLGISFITFSAVSALADTYNGKCNNMNFLDFALYMTFFPKIIMGPIVFWRDFSVGLKSRSTDSQAVIKSINKMVIGFAKKVIIADTLGATAATIGTNIAGGIDILTAWGLAFIYMLQIYYDFSGYSDIAIGLSRIFGLRFDKNFNFPYVSASITEFWRRWHISLGGWFKEYLYIPLGGNRRGKRRTLINLSVVFIATGVWHGAGAGYLAWGMLHGGMMIAERLLFGKAFYEKIPVFFKWLVTMLVVMVGWLFFYTGSFSGTLEIIKLMLGIGGKGVLFADFIYYFSPKVIFIAGIGAFGAIVPCLNAFKGFGEKVYSSKPAFVCCQLALALLFGLSVMFMVSSTYSPFIYFQY